MQKSFLAAIFLFGLPCCNQQQEVPCGEGRAELVPDGQSAVFLRSWCEPGLYIFGGAPLIRSELVHLSLGENDENTLAQPPDTPRMTGITGRVGTSPEGRYVAVIATVDTDVDPDVYREKRLLVLHDLQSGVATEIDVSILAGEGLSPNAGPDLASGAEVIVFGYSVGGAERVFAYTWASGLFEEVSVDGNGDSLGFSTKPLISDDGQWVAFESRPSFMELDSDQVYVRHRAARTTQLVSANEQGEPANRSAQILAFSGDGRFVAFVSTATNLPGGVASSPTYWILFIADRMAGTVARIAESIDFTGGTAFSSDGEYLVFSATLPDDDNSLQDVILYRRSTATIERISVGEDGTWGNFTSNQPSISSDGAVVLFQSEATNLPGAPSVDYLVSSWYLYETSAGTLRRLGINDIR